MRLALPAVSRTHPDHAALQLANLVFGGYFSSRWVENIREDKGYTYGPHSLIEHSVAGSSLLVAAEVATEVTGPALLETMYELGRLASLAPKDDELEQARQYALGTLQLGMSTQAGLAGLASTYAGFGLRLSFLADYAAQLAKVTRDDVAAAAAKYLAPARAVTVVLGDASRIEDAVAALAPVERMSVEEATGLMDLAEVTAPPLARSTLDRAAHHRDDAAWLASAWPGARLLMVDPAKGASLVRESDDRCALVLLPTTGDGPGEAMFLGVEPDGVAVFAVAGPLPTVEGAGPGNLRDMGHLLDDRDAGLFTTALALANWHAGHPYSSITGLPTTVRDAGWSRVDEAGKQLWPRTDPAMIVLVHDGVAGPDGRCLLGNNAAWPRVPGVQRFSCLAGYVEPGESAEAAVAREVAEEVGIALDRRRLHRQPVVAVPGFADARLPRAGRPDAAGAGRPDRDHPGALVQPCRDAGNRGRRGDRCRRRPAGQPADARLDRVLPDQPLAGVVAASRFLTSTIDGLVSAPPSGKRTVGTVWLPPLTLITYSAAAWSRSMSTTS